MYNSLQKVVIFKIIQEKIRWEMDRQIKFFFWMFYDFNFKVIFILKKFMKFKILVKGFENIFSLFFIIVQ